MKGGDFMSDLTTSIWGCYGNTVIVDGALASSGRFEDQKCYLDFQVATTEGPKIQSFDINEPIRSIDAYTKDKIENGIIKRTVGELIINEASFFEINNTAWNNLGGTIGFYIYNPLKIKTNSKVRSANFIVIENIMSSDHVGIKGFDNVIGIRILKRDVGISSLNEPLKEKLANYLKLNPITILYELIEPSRQSFEGAFKLMDANNSIVNINTPSVDNFYVEYPAQVIVTSMIDFQQIRTIGSQVAADKVETQTMVEASKELLKDVNLNVSSVNESVIKIEDYKNEISNSVTANQSIITQVNTALENLKTLQSEIQTTYEEIKLLDTQINGEFSDINQSIVFLQTDISSMKQSVVILQTDMNVAQTDVSSMKESIIALQEGIKNAQTNMLAMSEKINELIEFKTSQVATNEATQETILLIVDNLTEIENRLASFNFSIESVQDQLTYSKTEFNAHVENQAIINLEVENFKTTQVQTNESLLKGIEDLNYSVNNWLTQYETSIVDKNGTVLRSEENLLTFSSILNGIKSIPFIDYYELYLKESLLNGNEDLIEQNVLLDKISQFVIELANVEVPVIPS